MVRIRNAGAQITVAFGSVEYTDLYDKFFITFMEVCAIDPRGLNMTLLSDQGSTLPVISTRFKWNI
jgi:hypothetical protein